MNEIERQKVILRLPKKLVAFLEVQMSVLEETKEEYLERSIIDMVRADLDALDAFTPTPAQLVKKFGLQEIYQVKNGGVDLKK